MAGEYIIGVDVGTASVRAGIFDLEGTMVAHGQHEIRIWRPEEKFVEQSSDDVWNAACMSVQRALADGNIAPEKIIGISFDATCSLVALDGDDRPISISPSGNPEQNIIVWMDHRAIAQAARINSTRHKVLRYVGGQISPEMEPPKLLWIKENLHDCWNRAARFLDLADFMTYRSTGTDVRSLCTTVCKWTYVGHESRWDGEFYKRLGMMNLLAEKKIGTNILPMGTYAGNLTDKAAGELGLTTRTRVAVGIIDAHAGGLGVMGLGFDAAPRRSSLEQVLALIGGTSSCHMAVSRTPRFIPGVWGPYYGAMIPGMWLTEGGQSATGSLLDYIIRETSEYPALRQRAVDQQTTEYDLLNTVVKEIQRRERCEPEITKEVNILPYFHGNRSPRADPTLRGIIAGVTLDGTIDTVARRYYAAIQAIAYGTRHIIETMNAGGYRIKRIHACGGGTKNRLWLQEHADITGCDIVLPKESEAVLLGSAMLAAVGAGRYASVGEAAFRMTAAGERYRPRKKYAAYHDAKYKVFKSMYVHFQKYRSILACF